MVPGSISLFRATRRRGNESALEIDSTRREGGRASSHVGGEDRSLNSSTVISYPGVDPADSSPASLVLRPEEQEKGEPVRRERRREERAEAHPIWKPCIRTTRNSSWDAFLLDTKRMISSRSSKEASITDVGEEEEEKLTAPMVVPSLSTTTTWAPFFP